jgi:hypothetical protein
MRWLTNRRLWLVVLLLLAALAAAYAYIHAPLPDDDELHQVALDPADPDRSEIGQLTYLGGLDIPRMGQDIGGLSGLRWDADSGRLLAITDDARWVWLTLEELDGRLVGLRSVASGPLLGLEGEVLSGKAMGDSESLTRSAEGGWLVGFERTHRVWRYPELESIPVATEIDPEALLGELGNNQGLEAMTSFAGQWIGCVEARTGAERPNCTRFSADGESESFSAGFLPSIAQLGAVPTDADTSSDGTTYMLYRDYGPTKGNSIVVGTIGPDLTEGSELMVLTPPLTTDNFEGLAVREEGENTFLYIVSDDNFSGRQRTLLMKFALNSEEKR